jgi:peptidoglycan/LPS O-acetylase OafA/YrhL
VARTPLVAADLATLPHRPGFGYVAALDGLRGLAVIAVLAFHGGMPWARGGFLGVDAFFVLSGYLITGLLLAEWARTGRIALGAFWARRARRLLPALLLMVTVVALGARALLPLDEVRRLRGDGLAALLYAANWRRVLGGGDYFAQTASPSPLEHTWSLAVEEQFYVVWPLVVAALLAGSVTAARRTALARVLLICVAGAAAATVLLASVYRPDDPGRAYYGTDTRGASLLVGAALAVLLARIGTDVDVRVRTCSRWIRTVLAAGAGLSLVGLGWAWSRAEGGDAWLYHGGLLLAALAVAVLLAHVVLEPRGATARVLAMRPLVLVGRISYGLYLWHWPVFLALTSGRTGRQGTELFLLRCAVTLAVAVASYLLVERPIRTRGLPSSLRVAGRTWVTATIGFAAVAALVVAATAVAAPRSGEGSMTLGTALPPELAGGGAPAPDQHTITGPGRDGDARSSKKPARAEHRHPLPGRDPVISVFGDSVAWSLVNYLPSHQDLDIRGRTILGCGVARKDPYRYFGQTYPAVGPDCAQWPTLWRRAIASDDPDVALIMVGRWETMDRMLDGRWTHVGDPGFDAYLRSELELAIETGGAHGAQVVLATEPYNRRGEQLDGSLFPEDEPGRVTAWNALLRDVAADHPDVEVLDFGARVSPEGRFSWTAGGVTVRSDGLHLTPSGVQEWIAPWLFNQLRSTIASRARDRDSGDAPTARGSRLELSDLP